MHELIWTGVVCALVFFSMCGWGDAILRLLGVRASGDIGLAAALGMAFLCVLGGVLNLLQVISAPLVFVLLTIGWIAAARSMSGGEGGLGAGLRSYLAGLRREPLAVAVFGIVGVLAVFFVLSTGARPLNGHDDHQAYLVFAERMVDAGSIGDDPFNERRLFTWGGQSFLQALMLPLIAPETLGALDGGVAWLVFLALVLSHARRASLGIGATAFVLLFWHAIPPPAVNLSSLVTGIALLYGYFYFLSDERWSWDRGSLVVCGLFVAALASLKNSLIPGVVFVSVAMIIGNDRWPLPRRWVRLVQAALVGALFCVPWMVAMYQSSGTPLFPLLGRGVQGFGVPYTLAPPLSPSLGDIDFAYLSPILVALALMPMIGPGALMLGAKGGLGDSHSLRMARKGFVAAMVATVILVIGALGLVRYGYSCAFAAFAFLTLETVASHRRWRQRVVDDESSAPADDASSGVSGWWRPWLALVAFALLGTGTSIAAFAASARAIARFEVPEAEPPQVRSARAAQEVIPGEENVLSVLAYPYALDYRRNDVFVVDVAGNASPPPGLPLAKTALDVARYLMAQNIRYVMYSYADEARYGPLHVGYRLDFHGSLHLDRLRIYARSNIRFRGQLIELAALEPPIYDDGYMFVLDLAPVVEHDGKIAYVSVDR